MRSAPRAPSRAAPVLCAGPDTTTAWPRVYLCPSMRARDNAARHSAGRLTRCEGSISSSTRSGMPMSASRTSPHSARPGSSRWPGFCGRTSPCGRLHHRLRRRPGRSVEPARHVDRQHRRPLVIDGGNQLGDVAFGRSRKPRSENRVDHQVHALQRIRRRGTNGNWPASRHLGGVAFECRAVAEEKEAHIEASLLKCRAATKPSPPLLPGPQRTTMRALARVMATAASATAWPAFSIRSRLATPGRDRRAIGFKHFRSRQQFVHVAVPMDKGARSTP